MKGEFVLVRTRNAGVHCGILKAETDTTATLADARIIWRWRGANTLRELANNGADLKSWTRISEPVSLNKLCDVIEVMLCTKAAEKNLKQSRWLD